MAGRRRAAESECFMSDTDVEGKDSKINYQKQWPGAGAAESRNFTLDERNL